VGFSNPILAGSVLVRSAIRSPDYVSGTAGWIVSADGTAEFSDVAIRGEFTINGPDGRSVRGYVSPDDIPVIDFTPIAPTTPGWTVSNGSVYEYAASGYETLGLSSPVQYQPGATGGPALVELRSGKTGDPYAVVQLTGDTVVINSPALFHAPSGLYYQYGQKGVVSATASGAPTATFPVTFPTAFQAGTNVQVFCNIIGAAGPTSRCHVRAISATETGFTLFVESSSAATNLAWVAVPVGWLAVAEV
jgi:hypothetical protein